MTRDGAFVDADAARLEDVALLPPPPVLQARRSQLRDTLGSTASLQSYPFNDDPFSVGHTCP